MAKILHLQMLFLYDLFFFSHSQPKFALRIKLASNARLYRCFENVHTDRKFSLASLWTSSLTLLQHKWGTEVHKTSLQIIIWQTGSQPLECTFSPLLAWSDIPPLSQCYAPFYVKSRLTNIVSNGTHTSNITAVIDLHRLIWNIDKGQKEKITPERGENIYPQSRLLPQLMCLFSNKN